MHMNNLARKVAPSDHRAKHLVNYDAETDTITVDDSAPDCYKELAALHASICHAHRNTGWEGEFAPELPLRCIQIDNTIASSLDYDEAIEYLSQRIDLFDILSQSGPLGLTVSERLMFGSAASALRETLEIKLEVQAELAGHHRVISPTLLASNITP